MKKIAFLLLVFLVGCGGGAGSESDTSGTGTPQTSQDNPLTSVKLKNSKTGNSLSDGSVEVRVVKIEFTASKKQNGSCCDTSISSEVTTLGRGAVDSGGTFSFLTDVSKMPETIEEFISYDFSNPHADMDTPEEANSMLNLLLGVLPFSNQPGYYIVADGPGFSETIKKVNRQDLLPGTTVVVMVDPL